MGLAAGQARLLTITARKSDCEFQSMRLSHQKIALSRELADISNEYQNSLDQTKLYYDYYGTGDTSTPLSYGILMSPSTLNDYMPITLTDSLGRVTLNSKYAAAARAAGIPQEGLGTLPSEAMRNTFIESLYSNGIVNKTTAETILGLPYNQAAGFGGGTTVAVETRTVDYNGLVEALDNYSTIALPDKSSYNLEYVRAVTLYNNTDGEVLANITNSDDGPFTSVIGKDYTEASSDEISLADVLTGDYVMVAYTHDDRSSAFGATGGVIDAIVSSPVWDAMDNALASLFDIGDGYTQQALEYAKSKIDYMISNQCADKGPGAWGGDDRSEDTKGQYNNDEDLKNFAHRIGGSTQQKDTIPIREAEEYARASGWGYVGLVARFNYGEGRDDDSCLSAISVNLSSVLKAYITYFADYMNGISKTDSNGDDLYYVGNQISSSNFVTDDALFEYTIAVGTTVSSDDLGQATFYDALFNQICANGWTENNKIDDNEYLQQMLQSGMLFISKAKDDGFYYQGNYATDTYIKEVTDETKVAEAEAKYQTEKARLNAKEETLDLKMKNLDTEISSLTTEYDTVKNTISKNIEKSFKRYNA